MSAWAAFFTLWALFATGFTVVAALRSGGGRSRTQVRPLESARSPGRVLLLRPVDAPTAQELLNLAAPPMEGVRQVVLSPYALRLPTHVQWLPSDPPTPNRKAGHLAYAVASLPQPGEVVVSIDADVRVDAELLASLVGPVRAGAALCTAAPLPAAEGGLWGRALRGLLGSSSFSFVAIDAVSWGARPVCGKAMALSPLACEELQGLTRCVGEDLELAQRLHAKGARVALADRAAPVPQPVTVSRTVVRERVTRWMQVLRAHRPGLYPSIPLLFACTPLVLLGAAASASPVALTAAALLTVSRLGLAARLLPRSRSALVEWLLGEGLLLDGFVRSLGRSEVTWRGRRMQLLPGGELKALLEHQESAT